MLWNTFQIERTAIFKRRLTWVSLAILALLVMIIFGGIYSVTQSDGSAAVDGIEQLQHDLTWAGGGLDIATSFAAGANLGGIIVIILVGAATAQAYSWQVVQLWLSRGVSRATLLLAKFGIVLLIIVTVVSTTLLVGGLMTGWMSVQFTGGLGAAEVEWTAVIKTVILTAMTLLPYATLTFLIAIVTRSTIGAIGGMLSFTLLLEGLLGQILSSLNEQIAEMTLYLPSGLARSLLAGSGAQMTFSSNGETIADFVPLLTPQTAVIGITVYTILFVSLAIVAFHRQDLSS